ncbi:MAG TPA: (Fe-S)-binding protein [bacterium]|nr:(Fe-S)-binding protein [bacterium]
MEHPEKAASLCSFCPKLCRYTCPVSEAEKTEAVTPWGKMTAMKRVEDKELPMAPETMALAYKCLNCRASEFACEHANPVSPTLDTYRVRAFRADMAPKTVYAFCQTFRKHNNPYDRDLQKTLRKKISPARFGREGTVYFPGCREIATDLTTTEKTIDLLGIPLYPEPIQCCGYPLFAAGDWTDFTELAEVNRHALNNYDRIVTGAPQCLYTMETLYRSAGHGVRAKFQHVSEYLTSPEAPSLIRRGLGAVDGGGSVAYHDPCYLGRYRKTYDAPRKLIERVTHEPPLEFLLNRESSYCCGGGGLMPVSFPETADAITKERVRQFRETGAELLVTSCPACVERFRKFGVETKSLVDFLSGSHETERKSLRRR